MNARRNERKRGCDPAMEPERLCGEPLAFAVASDYNRVISSYACPGPSAGLALTAVAEHHRSPVPVGRSGGMDEELAVAFVVFPGLWAQIPNPFFQTSRNPTPMPAFVGTNNAPALPETPLELRRFLRSTVMSGPDPAVTIDWAWKFWLIGLLIGFVLILVIQGPKTCLRQLADFSGQRMVLAGAIRRIFAAGRLLGLLLIFSVAAWSYYQFQEYRYFGGETVSGSMEEVKAFFRGGGISARAAEQGVLALALPMRGLFGLGQTLLLLGFLGIHIFLETSQRSWEWNRRHEGKLVWYALFAWGFAAMHFGLRIFSMASHPQELTVTGIFPMQEAVVLILSLCADALVFSWIVVELRDAGRWESESQPMDASGIVRIFPGMCGILLIFEPGWFLAQGYWAYFQKPGMTYNYALIFPWVLGVQCLMPAAAFVLGALAWTRGTWKSIFEHTVRIIREQGGRCLGIWLAVSVVSGLSAWGIFQFFSSLIFAPWILAVCEGYISYASLAVGLILLGVMVEAGELALPSAVRAVLPDNREGSL